MRLRQLGVYALTTRLPLPATPGSPLCLAHSDDKAFDGLEIALKGGQVGGDDYFEQDQDWERSDADCCSACDLSADRRRDHLNRRRMGGVKVRS